MNQHLIEGKIIKRVAVSGSFPEHPNRCETCDYFKDCSTDFILLASHLSYDPSVISSMQGLFMTLIALKGCASHSSISGDTKND